MIRIDLKLFVTLSKYHPCGGGFYDIEDGTTVAAMIRDLGIVEDTVKLIFINGKKAMPDHVMCEGDRVGLFPPVGGG